MRARRRTAFSNALVKPRGLHNALSKRSPIYPLPIIRFCVRYNKLKGLFMKATERLDDLMRLLLWEGRLRNQRLRELFQLGIVRASQLIQELRAANEDATSWDPKKKAFIATPALYRKYRNLNHEHPFSLDSYLALVTAAGQLDDRVLVSAYRDLTPVSPDLFSFLHTSVVEHTWLRLKYRSMSNPEPHFRTVFPTALVRTGSRWHLRGWTQETASHRDYNLGRITSWESIGVEGTKAPADKAWERRVKVRLVAHPALSPAQADVVRWEYLGGKRERQEPCRAALLPYLMQEFNVALDPKSQTPPRYLLSAENSVELQEWMWPQSAPGRRQSLGNSTGS